VGFGPGFRLSFRSRGDDEQARRRRQDAQVLGRPPGTPERDRPAERAQERRIAGQERPGKEGDVLVVGHDVDVDLGFGGWRACFEAALP